VNHDRDPVGQIMIIAMLGALLFAAFYLTGGPLNDRFQADPYTEEQ
jgi:hypothetical protein